MELLGVIKGETPDLDTIQKLHFGSELLGVIKGETPDLDAIAGCRVRLKFVPRISFRNLEFASDSNSCTTQIRAQLKFAFKSNCGHS